MNRREFLKGGVASSVAVCGSTLNAAISETDAGVRVPTDTWISADVVVCGGGPAGVCAAVSAARAGAKVVLASARSRFFMEPFQSERVDAFGLNVGRMKLRIRGRVMVWDRGTPGRGADQDGRSVPVRLA